VPRSEVDHTIGAMASNLACIGLAAANEAELNTLVGGVLPRAVRFGRDGEVELYRWQDPSGARLIVGMRDGQVISLLPSFAAERSTRLAGVRRANADVAIASVVDEDGEQMTSLALELEQIRLLPEDVVDSAAAAITFLGRRVSVHTDSEAFSHSAESLLDPKADPNEPAPAHYIERGLKWPPRVGDESFFSYGVFTDPTGAEAVARFAGVVRHSERRAVHHSGQAFVVATIQTVGIEATVCLSGAEFADALQPGQVVAGEAFVVGSVPELEQTKPAHRWWRRRRA
jgi:hypothetical protein